MSSSFRQCAGISVAAFFLLTLSTACALDPFRVTEQPVSLESVPESWKSLRIALITDLHLTSANWKNLPYSALPEKLNELKPDLILIAGDIFHSDPIETREQMTEEFHGVFSRVHPPPLGIIAIGGNHDMNPGLDAVHAVLKAEGIRVPEQELLKIPLPDGTSFHLAALEGKPDGSLPAFLQEGVLEKFAPCLLLSHYPENFDPVPRKLPVLVVAGHTHGGLVHLPGMTPDATVKIFTTRKMDYVYGLYRKGKKYLFVSAGIGAEGSSRYRINNPPEIVLIEFR